MRLAVLIILFLSNAFVPEPYIESVPQILILLIILTLSFPLGDCRAPVRLDVPFLLTFSTSVGASSFGLAKFIKSGPAGIIKTEKCLMGFGTGTFILTMLSIAAVICGKGGQIAFYVGDI